MTSTSDEAQRQRLAFLQIGIDELAHCAVISLGDAGEAVARQIGEDEVRLRLAVAPYLEEVDGLGAAGSVAGLGDLAAHKRVDQARLADIRAANEGDLGRARLAETAAGRQPKSRSASEPSYVHYGAEWRKRKR